MVDNSLIRLEGLRKWFPIRKGLRRKPSGYIKAVDDVSFDIKQRETLGLVGESGCGKTTIARCMLRAIEPTSGHVYYRKDGSFIDLTALEPDDLRNIRQEMRLIFQDPYSSLNPRMTVRNLIAEPLIVNGVARGAELELKVADLLQKVGLRPEYMRRYPHAFSGGQRQRIGIARALALDPNFVICDEPVSALDVSVQAQILNLLQDLQTEMGLTYLFISHDLGVIHHISDRIVVMYVGKVVELGYAESIFRRPTHPYSAALLSSAPVPNPELRSEKGQRAVLRGEVPDAGSPPSGCYFHPRCSHAQDKCRNEYPDLRSISNSGNGEHLVACHFAEQFSFKGVFDDFEAGGST
ncbi:MAG: ATP-binding cassette domain-containing protein [Firmicutes bacterium]|nr:ATP-binding cassette domain-containing protein [Bacillota bacterium]